MRRLKRWYDGFSITVKFVITITFIVIPFIVGAIYTSSRNDEMDDYGTSYNIVLSQRMRVFLVSSYVQSHYDAHLENNEELKTSSAYVLDEQVTELLDYTNMLLYGDESVGVRAVENAEIEAQLELLIPMVEDYAMHAENILDDPSNIESRDYVINNAIYVDKEFYDLAVLYENIYIDQYNLLSSMNVLIVMISILVVGTSLFLLRLLKKIEFHAKYDALTKARSRSLIFDDTLKLNAEDFTVLFLDIKKFRIFNDVYGNNVGDDILIRFVERLKGYFQSDMIYRFGGDEFIVLINDQKEELPFLDRFDEFKKTLFEPIVDEKNRQHHLEFAIGMVSSNVGVKNFELKINLAEDLRYDSGNRRLMPIIIDTKEKAQKRMNLAEAIKQAVSNDEIVVYFHPLIKRDGTLKGFESLARWKYNNEIINPGAFIPLINSNSIAYELDVKMIQNVGKLYHELDSVKDGVHPFVSINLSVDTLVNLSAEYLIEILDNTELPKDMVILEILEDVIIENKTRKKLETLFAAGYKIALDDFTTGATSFDYLNLPLFEYVKIDQKVVKKLRSEQDTTVLSDLVGMIHSANKDVVIEGIETKEELDLVISVGVDVIQGYYYAKPMNIIDTIEFIKKIK